MNVRQDLIGRLRALDGDGKGLGAAEITAAAGPISIEVALSDRDRHSVIVDEIRATGSFADLRAAAEALGAGVEELDERLALIELEQGEGLAVMRSAEPLRDDGSVEYWEAQLQPGRMSLARYRKQHDAADRERQGVPMLHRSLGRLVEEVAEALINAG